jgi:hypothetical protein
MLQEPKPLDPIEKAAQSALSDFWTVRDIPEDARRLVARAIRQNGRDKKFWLVECIRAGLSQYAGKKDQPAKVVRVGGRF